MAQPTTVTALNIGGQIDINRLLSLADSKPGLIPSCFIVNTRSPDKRIAFVSMPASISQDFSADWRSETPVGRIEPIRVFEHTNATTLGFELQFYAQGNAGKDVLDQIDMLRAFTVSTTERIPGGAADSTPTELPPPLALLIIGTFIRSFVIIKSVNVTWMEPYTSGDIMPMVAKAELSMEIVQFATNAQNTGISELAADQLATTIQPLNRSSGLQ